MKSLAFRLLPFLLLPASAANAKDEWPQWRGPTGQGHALDATDLPVEWSETKNVAWKTPVPGRGHSSPVISDDRIWLTTALETPASEAAAAERLKTNTGDQPLVLLAEVRLQAISFDRETGEIDRTLDLLTVKDPQWVHALNSYATPTPILEDGRLYAHFGSFGTVCVDLRSGDIVWKNADPSLQVMHENGPGSTAVLWRDRLIFHLDGSDRQLVAALDKNTGKIAWTRERSGAMRENPQQRKSYATPLIVEVNGKAQLVSPGADWLYGYDPADGRELWKIAYGELGFSNVPRPVAGDGMLFLSTGFGKTEIQAFRWKADGSPELAWREKKGAPRMPSPLLAGAELFFVSDNGILSCLDAKTGEVRYQERLGGNFSASPLLADGKLYLFSREGIATVLNPGPKFEKLGENTLDAGHFASVSAVEHALYIRTEKALYRIEKP